MALHGSLPFASLPLARRVRFSMLGLAGSYTMQLHTNGYAS